MGGGVGGRAAGVGAAERTGAAENVVEAKEVEVDGAEDAAVLPSIVCARIVVHMRTYAEEVCRRRCSGCWLLVLGRDRGGHKGGRRRGLVIAVEQFLERPPLVVVVAVVASRQVRRSRGLGRWCDGRGRFGSGEHT
jgi:hypothetical protein